jgi:hypothetical protein
MCAPTAAADIMEYWNNHGYPNMAVIANNQVVFDLRTAMGTTNPCGATSCEGSTVISNVSPGMQSYARGRGYSTATAGMVSAPSFATVTNAIGSPGPVLLTLKEQTYYSQGAWQALRTPSPAMATVSTRMPVGQPVTST